MTRPKLDVEKKKSAVVSIRFTEGDMARLRAAAERADMTITAWARRAILARLAASVVSSERGPTDPEPGERS